MKGIRQLQFKGIGIVEEAETKSLIEIQMFKIYTNEKYNY